MNCRPGDMAVIVRCPYEENIGRLVRVLQPSAAFFDWDVEALQTLVACPAGFLEDQRSVPAGAVIGAFDHGLRPIRGEEGDDESLTWAGKPESTAIERALGVGRVEA